MVYILLFFSILCFMFRLRNVSFIMFSSLCYVMLACVMMCCVLLHYDMIFLPFLIYYLLCMFCYACYNLLWGFSR